MGGGEGMNKQKWYFWSTTTRFRRNPRWIKFNQKRDFIFHFPFHRPPSSYAFCYAFKLNISTFACSLCSFIWPRGERVSYFLQIKFPPFSLIFHYFFSPRTRGDPCVHLSNPILLFLSCPCKGWDRLNLSSRMSRLFLAILKERFGRKSNGFEGSVLWRC